MTKIYENTVRIIILNHIFILLCYSTATIYPVIIVLTCNKITILIYVKAFFTFRDDGPTTPTSEGAPPDGGAPTPTIPPRLYINENRADIHNTNLNQIKNLRRQTVSSVMNRSDLFVKRAHLATTSDTEPLQEGSLPLPGAALYVPETAIDVTTSVEPLEAVDIVKAVKVAEILKDWEDMKKREDREGVEEDEMYYEIDRLFNKMMALNAELKAATQRSVQNRTSPCQAMSC